MLQYNNLNHNFRYDESAWGWNPMEKLEEMSEDSATYLVGFNTEDKPVAFSHFRFDMDYGSPVLYWYVLCDVAYRPANLNLNFQL